ncbi:hypothetical protein PENARI_c015G12012 [Penicillium arizonense]|uniref:Ketoreductase (KR) domain-containing protein n=1 Tax=Penicillium arizonense TaxID=1835702 RepID=A0A1F5LDC7_PENAI|nr:hypothetical protein PENARI_c015G12012 [Penicillium arizonense]OGE51010.1 hypothetical protein PENARI_c015G12012 [Penicillium arizonense]
MQGIDRVFAANCVGHQVLVTLLLPLLKAAVTTANNGLANILFSKELSHRLLQDTDPASKRIYVNSFFPGNIVTDQWASWDSYFGTLIGSLIRLAGSFFGQSLEQGATTAVYLAASADDWIDDKMNETLGLNWQSAISQKELEAPTGRRSLDADSA